VVKEPPRAELANARFCTPLNKLLAHLLPFLPVSMHSPTVWPSETAWSDPCRDLADTTALVLPTSRCEKSCRNPVAIRISCRAYRASDWNLVPELHWRGRFGRL